MEKFIAAEARILLLPGACSYRHMKPGYNVDLQVNSVGGLVIFVTRAYPVVWVAG